MKTLEAAVLNTFNSAKPSYFKKVYLCRRVWNGSAFSYEEAADITSEVVEIGKIQIKLDTEAYNKWTYSNCALTLRNDRNQWLPGNPDGYFPDGKCFFNSKIRIVAGIVKPDGTQDPQYIYTGYLTDEPAYYPDAKTVQLLVVDHMSVFAKFNAEDLGTTVTNELLGTDSGTEFTTANAATGLIKKVLRGQTSAGLSSADELDSGTDYSVSNLNEHDTGATITLDTALATGQSLWVTYIYWPTDKTIEWIVAQICSLCGVENTSISAAYLENLAKSTFSQDETTFDADATSVAGTLYNLEPGLKIVDNYGTVYLDENGLRLKITGIVSLNGPVNTIYKFASPGYYITPTIDGGEKIVRWGKFNANYTVPSGTTAGFSWRESDNGSTWSAWNVVTSGSTVGSTKRYLQLRWEAAMTAPKGKYDASPWLFSWSVDYYDTTTTIPVVNFTGLTCESALQSLAEMVAYEIGFDATDTFIFRPRTSGSATVDTLDNAKVSGVDNFSDGLSKLYTRVKADFGDYSATIDPDTQAEAAPNKLAVYGVIEYSVSSGNFIPGAAVNLAESIALTVYNYVKDLRRRAQVGTRFFLHLELGDKVTLEIIPLDLITPWKWGDGSVRYGQPSKAYYYNADWLISRLPLYGKAFRVEGAELDLENWKTTFNLTEAL